jgi:hypothetical protein
MNTESLRRALLATLALGLSSCGLSTFAPTLGGGLGAGVGSIGGPAGAVGGGLAGAALGQIYKESQHNGHVQEAVQALTEDGVNGLVMQQLEKQKSTFDTVVEGIYHTILLCCIGAALYIFIPIIWTKYHVQQQLNKK